MKSRCCCLLALWLTVGLASFSTGEQLLSSPSSDPQVAATQRPPQTMLKVGLAPHDRPACQLAPVLSQRRNTASSQSMSASSTGFDPTNNLPTTPQRELPLAAADSLNVSASESAIVAPSITSLPSQLPGKKLDSSERLRQLRQLLASNSYDAYLVTPNDEHGSEYVTDYDRRLRFISGFTGSNGYALILLDRAVLFTDGRYAIQADQDLDCNWWLVVSDEPLADIHLWLKAHSGRGLKVATDARLMSLKSFDYLDEQLKKLDSEFVLISQDLVDVVWNHSGEHRATPQDMIFVHPLQFAGNVSWQEKVLMLAEQMQKLQARHYIISQLDDIAWLLNLRGNDIPMAPLFKSYLLISRSSSGEQQNLQRQQITSVEQLLAASSNKQHQQQQPLQAPQVLQVQPNQSIRLTLFVDLNKVDRQVRDHLQLENGTLVVQHSRDGLSSSRIQLELKDYDVFIMELRERVSAGAANRQVQGRLLLDAAANVAIHVLAKGYEQRLILMESLIQKLKSVKSELEVQGMRNAHWRDSLAISMLLAQLEQDIGQKGLVNKWSETSAANELEFYRSLMDYNKGQSFDTISAYGSNSAIVHYKPSEESEQRTWIGNQSTYLLDCGGQYLDGTTDITRTMHYGEPSEFQRETYTRVLMGSIDMMSIIFDQPARSPYRLNDLLARRHLFELGLDYMHGTGHGIGLYSLVHEAPALIEHYTSSANQRQTNANKQQQAASLVHSDPILLQANMFTSVEPGYYKAGDFGIRLENIVVTQRVQLASGLSRPNDRQESRSGPNNERQFLRFEPISVVPFEPKLIKLELLSNKQKTWLNSYNLMIRLRLTQQINHYLAKIKNQHSSLSVQVQGTASSSRLYQQHLGKDNNKSINIDSQTQLGQLNFVRLNGAEFQEKLEKTHKWILAKTELIPLDLSRDKVGHELPRHSFRSSSQPGNNKQQQTDEEPSSSQRLMLAYMSSFPFHDQSAADLMASLRPSKQQLAPRTDSNWTSDEPQTTSSKCAGLECDLWLVDALNGQPAGSSQRHRAASQWQLDSDHSLESSFLSGSLSDLFQIGTQSDSFALNMWLLLLLAFLAIVQITLMTYMCRSRSRSSHLSRGSSSQPVSCV